MHRPVMVKMMNLPHSPMKKYTVPVIGSPVGKNERSTNDQFITIKKCRRKQNEKVNPIAWEIKSHIMAAGYTQKEAVEACATEFGWSDSDSNFSNKLKDQTLRYKEALELAQVLGYEIVWRKRRDD